MESDHRGRPKVDFSMSSSRSKRRRLAELAEIDETAVSDLLNEFEKKKLFPADPIEIISLLIEASLSKNQYLLIRNFVNTKIGFDLFSSYQSILHSKKMRYPENIFVDESHAEVEFIK